LNEYALVVGVITISDVMRTLMGDMAHTSRPKIKLSGAMQIPD